MLRLITLTSIILIGSVSKTYAQQFGNSDTIPKKYAKYLSGTFNYGWIWKHRESITNLPETYPKGVEINIGWQTNGKKIWNQLHNFPRWGFQILYFNLEDPHLYGHAIHITPYMDLFFLKRQRHEIYVKIGTGLAFYPVYYNKEKNPGNVLISSPVSASGLLSFNYRLVINSRWSTLLAFNFNHASNGSFRQPNLGINIPALAAGIHYTFHPQRVVTVRRVLPEFKKSWNFNANFSFGIRQSPSEPLNNTYYLGYALSSYISKRFTRKSIVMAGLDGCYDNSLKYYLRNEKDYINHKYSIARAAATVGYEFVLTEKTHILIQNAFYIYNPYNIDVPVYQRYGFKFMPIQHLYLGYTLKTHLGKADFWEFSVGVRL